MSGEVARVELGVERAWAELQRHLSWSTGFVVLYVFVPTAGQAAALGDRAAAWADPGSFERRVIAAPEQLRELGRGLDTLLAGASRGRPHHERPLVWVEAPRVTQLEPGGAWAELLARLNERRELLRESLRGLVMVAPVAARGRFAALAPDLWSIRASSVELPAPPVESARAAKDTEGPRARAAEVEAARARVQGMPSVEGLEGQELLVALTARLRAQARLARVTGSRAALREARATEGRALHALSSVIEGDEASRAVRVDAARSWLELAEVALELEDPSLARVSCMRARAAIGDDELVSVGERLVMVEAWLIAGEIDLQNQAWEAAAEGLSTARAQHDAITRRAPSHLLVRIELGLARAARGRQRFELAEQHYRRALELDAGVVAARELGSTLVEAGELDRGLAELRAALELADRVPGPEQARVRRALAAAQQQAGRLDDARDTLEQARDRAEPDSALLADCLDDLSALLRALGEELDARRALGRALVLRRSALGPRHPLTLDTRERLEAMAAKSLVILHLSDLHFGPHSRFEGQKPRLIAERFARAIERERVEAGLATIDLVVVSGDIAEAGHKKQFELARSFFEILGGALGLRRDRFVFAPGNHDLSWPHIRRERENQQIEDFDDEELERRIAEQKLANFHQFLGDFYGEFRADLRRRSLEPTGWIHDFPELRLSVGVLDSCERETDLQPGGSVSATQAQSLLGSWTRADAPPWLRVLVVHHNPRPDFAAGVRSWASWLESQESLAPETIAHFVADTAQV